ncbi:hypothetical protein LINPERHAP2_LOCUS23832 [Linum perenne]
MGSPDWLIPWILLGSFPSFIATALLIRVFNHNLFLKLGTGAWCAILFPIAFAHGCSFSVWCFPHDLPILGSTRKFIFQMFHLHAAILLKYFIIKDKVIVFFLLLLLTMQIHAYTKHMFSVYDLYLLDVFLMLAMQSLIYWAPYWAGITCFALFVGYKFCVCGKNSDQLHQQVRLMSEEEEVMLLMLSPNWRRTMMNLNQLV